MMDENVGYAESDVEDPLEDLDDLEFDLPPIKSTPDLDDLLAASDVEEEEDSYINGGLNFDDTAEEIVPSLLHLDSLSIRSLGSINSEYSTSSDLKRKRKKTLSNQIYLKHIILKGISSQTSSACERADAGLPTVTEASTAHVAVGTSRGFILVFDNRQVLKWSFGGRAFEFGSVSAMSFNSDSTRLLVGFAKGHLIEFDLNSGKQLRELNDSHPLIYAVTHAYFTDDPSLAVIADSGGSVYEISFKRTLGVRGYKSRCIFSGSRGEACVVCPLSLKDYPDHRLSDTVIIALGTVSKVIILTIRPHMKVIFTYPLTGRGDTLPLLSWQFVIIQTSYSEKVVDPVIAFGRESTIFFYQMADSLSGRIAFVPLSKVEFNFVMLSMGWMNSRSLGIIDLSETFHLYDVRSKETLQSMDISEIGISYGTSFFKGLATGGNVSAALAVAGERAVYGSCHANQNQFLLLGRKGFHVLIIRTWKERIDYLIESNQYVEALRLGLVFYADHGKALIGLKGTKERRKRTVANKLVSTLLKFLHISMTVNFPEEGNMRLLTQYFSETVPPCIDVCMTLERHDLLFDDVWNCFVVDPFSKAIFLESLERFILSDRLSDLPVNISQEFVSHYEKAKMYEALEACITHLQVSSLDIHQVMSICRQHDLYDAIICIYNSGLHDFVTPMEEFLTLLSKVKENDSDLPRQVTNLGNKILVYVSCCLAGRAYPFGDIPRELVSQVKYEVYSTLTALHSKRRDRDEDELPYPHLRTLLNFDTQCLLNVIAIAFEEPEFSNGDLGRCQRQRLIDILLEIVLNDDNDVQHAARVGYLFTFLARQIAKDPGGIDVSQDLFDRVLEVLTDTRFTTFNDERQQALLDMIQAEGTDKTHFDIQKLIRLSEYAGFYRVLETVYRGEGRMDKVIECYLQDPNRHNQVFSVIQRIFAESSASTEALETLFIRRIHDFLKINVKQTAMIACYHLSAEKIETLILNGSLASMNSSSTELEYNFLKYYFELTSDVEKCGFYDRYLELMVRHDHSLVAFYLKTTVSRTYSIPNILSICQNAGLIDASAYLLEQSGKIENAFDLLRSRLDENIAKYLSNNGGHDLALSRVESDVITIVQFCQRTFPIHLDPTHREELWFKLLESLMAPQRQSSLRKGLKVMVKHLINSGSGIVPLRTMIERILRDPVYSAEASFVEVKDFLTEMLSMYRYEQILLESTTSVLRSEIHSELARLWTIRNKGISCRTPFCYLCGVNLGLESSSSSRSGVVFQCGHGFHSSCLADTGCCSDEDRWQCYSCLNYNHPLQKRQLRQQQQRQPQQLKGINAAKLYLDKFNSSSMTLSVFDSPEFPLRTAPKGNVIGH